MSDKTVTPRQGQSQHPGLIDTLWASLGAFISIASLEYVHELALTAPDRVLLIGSFGASAAIIYGAVKSPLGRLRNFVGGHLLSAAIGVTALRLFPDIVWLAGGLAVAVSVAVMCLTRLFHPPGGATALIAVIGSPEIHALGYYYLLVPVSFCIVVMSVMAILLRNGHKLHYMFTVSKAATKYGRRET